MELSEYTSKKIHVITFLCTFLVVVVHCKHILFENDAMARPVIYSLSYVIGEIAVPFFFLFSGYFLGLSYRQNPVQWYKRTLKKKFYTLFIPYCVWNTLYALTYVPFKMYANYKAGTEIVEETCFMDTNVSIGNFFCIFGGNLFNFPADIPFWYIRNLMFIVLIFPLFLAILPHRRLSAWLIGLSLCVYVLLANLPPDWMLFSVYGLSFRSFCLCFMGAYFAYYPLSYKPQKFTLWGVFVAWVAMVLIATHYKMNKYPDRDYYPFLQCAPLRIQILLGCFLLWFVYDRMPKLACLSQYYVVKNHFFIYGAHYAVMSILFCNTTRRLMAKFIGDHTLVFYFSRIGVTFAICLCGILLLRKIRPSWLQFLCGGRA